MGKKITAPIGAGGLRTTNGIPYLLPNCMHRKFLPSPAITSAGPGGLRGEVGKTLIIEKPVPRNHKYLSLGLCTCLFTIKMEQDKGVPK